MVDLFNKLLLLLHLVHTPLLSVIKVALVGDAHLALHPVELANLLDMVSFDLSQLLGSLLQLRQVGLLHILRDCLLALALLGAHLLAGLLEFHLAPLQVAVDGVAQDCDLAVELFVFPVVEFGLEAVSLCACQLLQLVIDLLQHVLDLFCSVHPNGRQSTCPIGVAQRIPVAL